MKADAIRVAIDILRELGLEEQARWIEHPGAVRTLFRLGGDCADYEGECEGCGAYSPHAANCEVFAAWHALNDPRAAADIERAHEEALVQARPPLNADQLVSMFREVWGATQQLAPYHLPMGIDTTTPIPLLCVKGRTAQGYHPCSLPENHAGPCEDTR